MKKATVGFLICNYIIYLSMSILRIALSAVSGRIGLSAFAVGALSSAFGALMLPFVIYFVCRRYDRGFADRRTPYEVKLLLPMLVCSVLALALVPRVATTPLYKMSKNALDILCASAALFVEYLPKLLLRGDYAAARLVGAAVWCAFVLVSYRVTARIAERRRDRWRTVRLRLDGRLALRLGGVLLGCAHFGCFALRASGGIRYGGIPTLLSLMLVAAAELMLFFESMWSLCARRTVYNLIRFCVAIVSIGAMLTCGWLSVSGTVLCNAVLVLQIILAILVRRKKMLSKKDIHDFLASNNIKSTDTLLVHTSFRSLGGVEGGCDGFIDAMCEYLADGLFIIPTHTWANVTAESPIFDVRSTEPCIGALPKTAAFRPDGVRSLHPTHSIVAFGKRAREFVSGEENARTPAPVGGVWSRLYEEGAKILLVGVGLNRNTYIHAIDEMIDLPDRLAEPVTLHVIGYEGEKYTFDFRKHGENTGSENFGVFEDALVDGGALCYAHLGEARVGIFDAVRGTEIIKELWANADRDLTRDI